MLDSRIKHLAGTTTPTLHGHSTQRLYCWRRPAFHRPQGGARRVGAEEQVGPIVSGGARVLQSLGELTAFPAA